MEMVGGIFWVTRYAYYDYLKAAVRFETLKCIDFKKINTLKP